MNSKAVLILAMVATPSASFAFGDDGPSVPATTITPAARTAAEFQPMTRSERLRNYLLSTVSAESVVSAAASAGIRQWEDSPEEWRGGAEGFGYRLGDAFAHHMVRTTLEYGASSVLHEDNRYFASGESGALRRIKYAVVSTFLARHDNGSRSVSYSRLGGAAGSAFISRIWQPRSTTSAGDGAVSFGISMGTDVGFNVFREFLPDLKRHFHKD